MSLLRPDLAALLPAGVNVTTLRYGTDADGTDLEYLSLTPDHLTAFALAVARQERARCADEAADRLADAQERTDA